MAAQHLTALSSPEFPQALSVSLDRLIDRVEIIVARNYLLSPCDFEDQFGDCREVATVHHLKSEHEFCERHFRQVTK